ncbi:Non-heme haloperoxidase [Frankia sp. Hr75.2]|uniref:non-heme haloperoxidase n=1 Tax=Parafrankia TaxID=2994362 RepID=UPI0000544274|nr:non-heme haloperoxidase [Parafrankia sp. Ea1.12]ABW11870.1 putative non-heme haloperoxidase [Frankia sp. EAN1pec]CAI7980818.1 Non-heme haloperoxidase [Frankia sp. Hr75.2]SQD96253.1 Non-heme haloperoxidase [Parafrankia sp. Ea1.12]
MTPSTTISPPLADYDAVPGDDLLAEPVRVAVAILMGRGESREPYEWLARRLALDGYAAAVVPAGGNVAHAVGEVRRPGLPFVLLGSDSGALAALAMAGSPAVRPDGLVLLGLPLLHVPVAGIPVGDPPPRVLPDLPILLIHGRDDPISPLQLVRMTTRTAARTELTVVPGGHAVLAGPGRRSVPARVLLFLEDLIAG